MKAAVVHDFGLPPAFREFDVPAAREDEELVSVSAAALSNLVKAQAAGNHYSSPARVPFVPGVDGVGRLAGGRRVYFAFPQAPYGTMAGKTAVRRSLCVDIPDELDDVTAAAAANPGMSSWAALTERAGFEAGESVLINGATGISGRLAIQIARHLGASRIIATGRNSTSREALLALGADEFIALDQPNDTLLRSMEETLSNGGVDVILDYLWGASAEHLIEAISRRPHGSAQRRVRFVQIGDVTGRAMTLRGSALRSSGLELLGSGLGSVPKERLVHTIESLLRAIRPARMTIDAEGVPLESVETTWNRVTSKRLVFTV